MQITTSITPPVHVPPEAALNAVSRAIPSYHEIVLQWQNPLLSADQHGNKGASLSELTLLFQEMAEVEVPSFMGVSHAEVQGHLAAHYPNYQADWAEFLELKGADRGLQDKAEFQLGLIQEKIEGAFASHLFISDSLTDFLNYSEKNCHLIMVRSSGDEDSTELANAGGNFSATGVYPKVKMISTAMGKVIASYHSPLSLLQREQAGQEIRRPPKAPVLLQVMIDESEGGPIPVSGVACSRELLGKTEALTQIQATYGHNEAVVNSLLPVDTFYVYPDGNCHQIIRRKEKRFVPGWASSLTTAENPKAFKTRPSLTKAQVELVERTARRIHRHYGRAMDIEWVFDTRRDILCLVQARPIVDKFPMDPETLNLEALNAPLSTHLAEAVVSVQGKVHLIQDPSQLIVRQNLEEAFAHFTHIAQRDAHHMIKAVVVRESAAATSHYACTLREMGIDLFICPSFESRALTLPEGFIAIDPQKELLLSGHRFPEGAVLKGWYRHPIAANESLVAIPDRSDREADRLARRLLPEGPIKITMDSAKLRNYLDELGSVHLLKAQTAARDLLLWIAIRIKSMLPNKAALQLLRNAAQIAEPLLFTSDIPRMHRLHAAKRLQALILQQRSAHIINSDSLVQLLEEEALYEEVTLPAENLLTLEEKATLASAEGASTATPMSDKEVKTALAIYELAKRGCLNDEATNRWGAFSVKIASSRSRHANRLLIKLIRTIKDHEILEEWLHFTFLELHRESQNMIAVLLRAATKLSHSTVEFGQLQALREGVERWESRKDEWSDPNKTTLLMAQFKPFAKSLIAHMTSFTEIADDDFLLKSCSMTLYKRFVELYDLTIKSLRGSPYFADKSTQAQAFKTLLGDYLAMAALWTDRIPDVTVETWTAAMRSQRDIPDPRIYRRFVERRYAAINNPNETELRPSAGFNVATRVIHSGHVASIGPLDDCTLEDLFMIAHQNLLAAFDAVFQPPWQRHFPPLLARVQHLIESSLNVDMPYIHMLIPVKATLLSCKNEAKNLTLIYTIPLKFHSAYLTLTYDKTSEKMTFDFCILGHNMGERMKVIATNLVFRGLIHDFNTLCNPTYNTTRETLHGRWESDEKMAPFLLAAIREAAAESIRGSLGEAHLRLNQLDQGSPRFWETLFTTQDKLHRWLAAGAPYYSQLLGRLHGEKDLLRKLFRFLGFDLPPSSTPLPIQLLEAIVDTLPRLPPLLQEEEMAAAIVKTYLQNSLLSRVKLAKYPTIITWLEKSYNQIVIPRHSSLATRSIVRRLQFLILDQLILSKDKTEDDLRFYLKFLKREGQPLANHLPSIISSQVIGLYKECKAKATIVRRYITEHAQTTLEPGYTPPRDACDLDHPVNRQSLKVEDKVLCPHRTGGWVIGRVVERSGDGTLKIDIEEEYLISITTDTPLYPAALTTIIPHNRLAD